MYRCLNGKHQTNRSGKVKTKIFLYLVLVLLLFGLPIYDYMVIDIFQSSSEIASLSLTDNQYKKVTKVYKECALWDSSRVDIRRRGQICNVHINDNATLTLRSGIFHNKLSIEKVEVYDEGTLKVESGTICNKNAYDHMLDDTDKVSIRSHDNGNVSINSGDVHGIIEALDNSKVSIYSLSSVYPKLKAHNDSSVNIFGGTLNTLNAHDTSSVSISGGTIKEFVAYNNSTIKISGGKVKHLKTCLFDKGTVNIANGSIDSFEAYNSSNVSISGGMVSKLSVYDSSTINICNATVDELAASDSSTVNISGGTVGKVFVSRSNVVFHGYDFRVTGELKLLNEALLGTGILVGKWSDGKEFIIEIISSSEMANIRIFRTNVK